MNTKGVNIQPSERGQFSAAVDTEKTTTGWRGTQRAQDSATWVDSREVGGDTSTAPVTSKEHTK